MANVYTVISASSYPDYENTDPNLHIANSATGDDIISGYLTSLTLYIAKGFGYVLKGRTNVYYHSNAANIKPYLEINGTRYYADDSSKNILGKYKFKTSSENGGATWANTYGFVDVNDENRFTWSTSLKGGIALNENTRINIRFQKGNSTSKTAWTDDAVIVRIRGTSSKNRKIAGSATIENTPIGPTKIYVDKTNTTITDLSGAAKSANDGVNKDYNVNLIFTGTDATGKAANFNSVSVSDSPDYVNTSNSVVDGKSNKVTVYVKAKSSNLDNTSCRVTLSSNGHSAFSTVNFYKKVDRRIISGDKEKVVNILDVVKNATPIYYTLNTTAQTGNNIKSSFVFNSSWLYNKSKPESDFTSKIDNNKLYLSDIANLSLNKDNYITPMYQNGNRLKLTWRFYNSDVQTWWSVKGTYKLDLDTYLTYYIIPDQDSQFSYEWKDIDGNVIQESDLPGVILGQENVKLTKMSYNNNSVIGGYCRGFSIKFIPSSGDVIEFLLPIDTKTEPAASGITSRLSELIDDNGLLTQDLGKETTIYDIELTPFFYFNDAVKNGELTKVYYGVSRRLKQKFLYTEEDITKVTVEFPTLKADSHMMLEDVERFGYNINSVLCQYASELGASFGLTINNNLDCNIKDNKNYFSSNILTPHLVFDASAYVKENKDILGETFTVVPYVTFDNGKTKIYSEDATLKEKINSDGFWLRPTVDKGNIIKNVMYSFAQFFDYDRCKLFMDKYINLLGEEFLLDPIEKGTIINTDYWSNVVTVLLDQYAEKMQNWATDATNFTILWAYPIFRHKKGEIITKDNLYQNYWDLLEQYKTAFTIYGESEGSEFPAVRLKSESGGEPTEYTHNYLNNNQYTHRSITNQFRKRV